MSQNILITGTNSGFGRLTALTLARRGHAIYGTMREVEGRNRPARDELLAIAQRENLRIEIVEMILSEDASVEQAVNHVLSSAGSIDTAISNAGFAILGLNETVTAAQLLEQMNVNVVGSQRLFRALLPAMRERRSGLLIQVSSGLGRLVLPLMGAYCASKAAVEALAEAYRYELRPTGVELSIVQPGAFPTEFRTRTQTGEEQARALGYGSLAHALDGMNQNLDRMLSGPNAQDPRDVAEAIVRIVESPPGTRPERTVVDKLTPDGVVVLNRAHAQVQHGMLEGMGMGDLAG
jgi:NAD(P)-dependent dehydrogenase (short-subunit alcohol dehydrogenase family)